MLGQRTTGGRSEVEPDVEAVRPGHTLHHANRLLREGHQLGALRDGEVLELGHPAVGHHHQVPGVVRVEVQHRVDELAAGDHQPVLVRHVGDVGERFGRLRRSGLDRIGDVVHPVRRPQPLQVVGLADALIDDLVAVVRSHVAPTSSSSAVGAAFSRRAIQSAMVSTATSRGTPLTWVRSPNRKLTAPASTSRSPASSMNGTFWLVWLTIFFAIRSSLVSTSTRIPRAFSCAATPSRYSTCPSATGMPTTWTGASQAGKAPA